MDLPKICIRCMKEKPTRYGICPFCEYDPDQYKPPSFVLPPFTVLNGKYLVGMELGAGGFGITYVALDMRLGRKVAIKEFFMRGGMHRNTSASTEVDYAQDDSDYSMLVKTSMEKFEEEARILARLGKLPGIVDIHDIFNENNTAYIVLEYLDGFTLQKYVEREKRHRRLSTADILNKMQPLMYSLERLHQEHILHRDISPDNIMVQADGIRLFDFGGARAVERSDSYRSAMVVRKKGFSPVEQVYNEKQGPWTDIYALAATIYFSITGTVPPESIVRMMEEDTLQPPSALGADISPAQERVLLKALAIKSKDRYQTVEEFRKALYEPAGVSRTDVSGTAENTSSESVQKAEHTSEENKEIIEKEARKQEIRSSESKKPRVGLILVLCLAAACFFAAGRFTMRKAIKDSRKGQNVESIVSVERVPEMSETGSIISESEAISETTMNDETAASVTDPVSDSKEGAVSEEEISDHIVSEADNAVSENEDKESESEQKESENYVIDWNDENLEKAVREALGITDRDITYDDVKDVKALGLGLRVKDIKDISALAAFENLTTLYLNHNQITDISALSGLTNLKMLYLSSNQITDISALSGLTNLTTLL
ncbi:protein kinase, partial [uncultured Ruminobacter sp.]|uniref:protein kinase domain-containing protein n=1 Tax=uncultured Ruminobacter sp. TaxID=538947 RepID=UPI0025F7B387